MMVAAVVNLAAAGRVPHPNDLDRKRIERALKERKRYRYVSPMVRAVDGGYLIESPCCSRNIDVDGGIIDIALLQYEGCEGTWQLLRKDHSRGKWELHSSHARLPELMNYLNIDPEREFWQ
jgi:hypothetical protein